MKNWQKVTRNEPCLGCGKPDWCSRSEDGAFACRRCSDEAGAPMVDKNGESYVLIPPEGTGVSPGCFFFEAPAAPEAAPVYLRDRVYQRICRELPLFEDQVQGLERRGLSLGAIQFHGLCGGPRDGSCRQQVARSIVQMLPNDWAKIPGLFFSNAEPQQPILGGSSGVWIPLRDLQGRIQGIKIRKDAVAPGESRYRTLTSTHRGGPGPGQVCSAWMPCNGKPSLSTIRICEGELKACIAAERTDTESFAAPGVAALGCSVLLEWLHVRKPELLLLAPDRDAFTNSKVRENTIRALELYQADAGAGAGGYRVEVEVWDGPNGIDDALVSGIEITREPLEAYLSRLRASAADVAKEEKSSLLPLLEQALLALAQVCDGAQAKDARGLSKPDRDWFAPHLESVQSGKTLTHRSRLRCLERISKYGQQLFELGFNINEVARGESELTANSKAEAQDEKRTQIDKLLALADEELKMRLIKSAGQVYGVMMVALENGGVRKECHRFGREGVRLQLLRAYRRKYKSVPSSEALTNTTEALRADASIDGLEEPVWIRAAQNEGKLYLDLANPQGEVVEVSAGSWRLLTNPPVNFIRPNGMLPLPLPVSGSSLLELRPYANLDETGWRLVLSWLLFSLFPLRPHPVLLLEGEQGSSKSCLARLLRSLVDPHASPLRKVAKSAEDAAVMAGSNWVFCLDNLAGIPAWLSDFLCGLATGSGSSQRKLFTDDDEHTISYLRPVLITGIGGLHGKADLGDRVLKVTLNAIDSSSRISEEVFEEKVAELRPRMLGALLDVAASALQNKGKVSMPALPRLADFAKTVIEAEEALPWASGDFLTAFNEARQEQIESALEDDPLAQALRDLALLQSQWEGTMTELLERLQRMQGSARVLPSVNKMQVQLRLLAPYMRAVGVALSFHRTSGRRWLRLAVIQQEPQAVPTPSKPPSKQFQQCVLSGLVEERSTSPSDSQLVRLVSRTA